MANNKNNAIVFFQYLPPWRIDVFNEMATYYNLTIVYTDAELEGFKYDRNDLLNRLDKSITNIFLSNGFKIGNRPIRFGICKLIRTIKPTVVFSHEYSPTSIIVAVLSKLRIFNYQYIITTSDNFSIAQSVKGVKAVFRKFVLSEAKIVVVYSNAVKKFYEDKFSNLKVEVCPNIQNPNTLLKYRESFPKIIKKLENKFKFEENNIILYTGRLRAHIKGLDLLLKAFAKSNNENYKLVLVGDGDDKPILVKMCETLNIKDKVVFAGFFSGESLYAWYELANFYILPSRFEPFGAVVNEALVFGCPVIASKYIGAVDFITKENGTLFNPLNESEFVAVLNKYYNKFQTENKVKKDLMPVSFKEYVSVFDKN